MKQEGEAIIQIRKAERFDPEDVLGTVTMLLEDYDFEEMPLISRDEHERLEKSIDASDQVLLRRFEKNAHRMNFIHKAYAVFDDVRELLPERSGYFLNCKQEIAGRYDASGVASGDTQRPVPHDVIIDLRRLLEEYQRELFEKERSAAA